MRDIQDNCLSLVATREPQLIWLVGSNGNAKTIPALVSPRILPKFSIRELGRRSHSLHLLQLPSLKRGNAGFAGFAGQCSSCWNDLSISLDSTECLQSGVVHHISLTSLSVSLIYAFTPSLFDQVLRSNIIPRWAVIGWLLCCTQTSTVAQNVKLVFL